MKSQAFVTSLFTMSILILNGCAQHSYVAGRFLGNSGDSSSSPSTGAPSGTPDPLPPQPTPQPISGMRWYVSPSGSDSNSGKSTGAPFKTLSLATSKAQPGDGVILMPGSYNESIVPIRSGTATAPITFTGLAGSPAPVLVSPTVLKTAILINNVSYITISGININGHGTPNQVDHAFSFFARILGNSSHITLADGDFRNANGYEGIMVTDTSSYVTIRNNTIDMVGFYKTDDPSMANAGGGGILVGDGISLSSSSPQYPHHVLIENNHLSHAGHDLMGIAGQYNVIRNNVMNNDWSNIPPVAGPAGYRNVSLNGNFNIFERNLLSHAGPGTRGNKGAWVYNVLMKVEGANNIVRNNVLAFNNYAAITSDSSIINVHAQEGLGGWDHIYNNTIYKVGSMAWQSRFGADAGVQPRTGDIFKNNLVEQDRVAPPNDGAFVTSITDNDAWIYFSPASSVAYVFGNLFDPAGGRAPIINMGGEINPLKVQASYSNYVGENIQASPKFVSSDPQEYSDFALAPGSAGIESGIFLTSVVGSGASNKIHLADVDYFTDGHGLIPGDVIRFQNSNQTAQVISVDRPTNILTLATTVSFTDGQGISLYYSGRTPNIGAF